MLDLIIIIVPIMLSLIALIVSIVVAWSNRKTLQVEIQDLRFVKSGTVFFYNNEEIPQPYNDGLLVVIEVVNPSPKDIAFFDLRAFYPQTNMNMDLLTKRTISDEYRDKTLWHLIKTSTKEVRQMELLVPDTNYGVFKSNSFTRFHIIIFPDEDANELLLSFKVAIKTRRKRDIFAVTGRKIFKMYGKSYNIKSWKSAGEDRE